MAEWIDELDCDRLLHSASRFSVDSRTVERGALFFALPGRHADGHRFLAQAALRGACAAVVSKEFLGEAPLPLIRVGNVLETLQGLGRRALERAGNPLVIAITGSVGKTTCKEWTASLLAPSKRLFASPGNSNSQIGLPLSLLNGLKGDEELLVLEMGMSRPGEIERLVSIAPPEIAAVTSIDYAHAEFFSSLEEIARAKAEIFSHPKTRLGLYPEGMRFERGGCPKRAFSIERAGPEWEFVLKASHLPAHQLSNLLVACLLAREAGLSLEEIKSRVGGLQAAPRRFQFVLKKGILFCNDAYNASPLSVRKALEALPAPRGGRKIAVLGEMLELGHFSEKFHREIGGHALECVEALYCLGAGCRPMKEAWERAGRSAALFLERGALEGALRRDLSEGDVVLVKGSSFFKMWELVETF